MTHTSETPEVPPSPSSGMGNVTFNRLETLVGTEPHGGGTSFNSQPHMPDFAIVYGRYSSHWPSGETHHIPSSTGPFIFGMQDITDSFPSYSIDLGVDPSGVPGRTTIHFNADQFGIVHIAPSALFFGGFP